MWKTVQARAGIARPVQLILNMKVRWSSTYLMLDRAEHNQTVSTYRPSYYDNSCFYSILIPLLMNCVGKKPTVQNMTRFVHSNWIAMSGRMSAHSCCYLLYVF